MIAQKMSRGYPAEEAYKLVMWDKKIGEKQMLNKQQEKQKLEEKRQASPVSPASVSNQSLPQPKKSFEEDLAQKLDTEWDGSI
jgi:hypothetical protein